MFGSTKGIRRGCLAEYAIIDAEVCCIKPSKVSHELAASVCLVGITSIMGLRACGLKQIDILKNEEENTDDDDDLPASDDIRVLITGGAGKLYHIIHTSLVSIYIYMCVYTLVSIYNILNRYKNTTLYLLLINRRGRECRNTNSKALV